MDDRTLRALEFPRVLERLSSFCLSEAGREAALALRPMSNAHAIRDSQYMYDELRSWMAEGEFRLCEYFQVHKNVDVSIYASAKVTFTAFAIQASGFNTTAGTGNAAVTAAWEAIKATYPFEGGIANPLNPYDSSVNSKDHPYAPMAGVTKATFDLLPAPANSNNSQGGTGDSSQGGTGN